MKRMLTTCLMLFMLLTLTSCSEEIGVDEASSNSAQITSSENQTAQSQSDSEQDPDEKASAQNEETDRKTLIAYFSLVDIVPEGADAVSHATPSIGNTEFAAMEIQSQVGGDLFAIKTVKNYPVSHSECSDIAEEEMRSNARPELSTHIDNMDEYDTVYIGYPIWWYIEPMAIRTFMEEYDFSGKTVVPFCTTLGAGIAESEENIAIFAEEATVLEGITLHTGQQDLSEDITNWLVDVGIK